MANGDRREHGEKGYGGTKRRAKEPAPCPLPGDFNSCNPVFDTVFDINKLLLLHRKISVEGGGLMDETRTREQLICEVARLRERIRELELGQQNPNVSPVAQEPLSFSGDFSCSSHQSFSSLHENQRQDHGEKYHISELIDIPLLQRLFDSFYELTGIRYGLHDADNNILSKTSWSDICTKFHRACPQTESRCRISDSYILDHLHDGPYVTYKCLNGLIDYATPIMVEGRHIGTIFTGQVLNEPPDEEYFRRQAREFGFDEAAYIEALHKVNIVPEDRIKSIMDVCSTLGQVLAAIGLERMRRSEAASYALLQSEEKFSKAFRVNPDPMSITTLREGRFVDVNDAYVKASGYALEEIIGHTVHEIGMWDVSDRQDEFLRLIKERGRIRGFEHNFRLKSGEIRTYCISAEVIRIDGERHLLCSVRDITDRNRMEAALRLSEECLSKAFDVSPIIMAITTLKEGRYIRVNRAFSQITGYSNEDIVGKSTITSGFWADPSHRDEVTKRLMANQSVRDMEIHFRKSNGEQRLGLYSGERIDINGEPCILSILMDITELRQMEAEMTRMDRLNVVGEMAASIGHEIRNPMTTVRGYLQLMRTDEVFQKEAEFLDLMIEELDRANSIITEFLSLAKDKMVELKPASLNKIIGKLWPLVKAKAVSRDQDIRLELSDLPVLPLDPKEIRQLIINLVNNGLESMPAAGVVTIETYMKENQVVLAVRDHGHGIDPKLLNSLGTPFITTKEHGTGLGLAVCFRIAARHNAKIKIDSSPKGTTVKVEFPTVAVIDKPEATD
jgi:two-component system, sporulation sensor kinase E